MAGPASDSLGDEGRLMIERLKLENRDMKDRVSELSKQNEKLKKKKAASGGHAARDDKEGEDS